MTDPKIHNPAGDALMFARGDIVAAVEILREWTDLGHDAEFAAIDALLPDDETMANGVVPCSRLRMEKPKTKIYVASFWRNEIYSTLVKVLRWGGHEVYDYREDNQFRWPCSNLEGYVYVLEHNPVRGRAAWRGCDDHSRWTGECEGATTEETLLDVHTAGAEVERSLHLELMIERPCKHT